MNLTSDSKRRFVFGLLLVIALLVGWFLHGIPFAQNNPPAGQSQAANVPVNAQTSPISSSLNSPTNFGAMPSLSLNSVKLIHVKLTTGLHPGLGEPIPAAADLCQFPFV